MNRSGGIKPTEQRLDADDALVLEVQHRLVDEEELLGGQRVRQVHIQLDAILRDGVHRGLEQRVAVLPSGLRLVQREVCVLQQMLGRSRNAGRDADARRHRDRRLGRQLDRLAQHIEDSLGDELRADGIQADVVHKHHELVPAEASDRVALAQHRPESRADLA